jgi:uncharacterized protein with gpF-like domain
MATGPLTRLRDAVAKGLWSGEVHDSTRADSSATGSVYHRNEGWSRTNVAVSKQDTGIRRGTVPEHIESPIKGRPRSYNPLSLRQLAKSGVVQSNMGAILGDLESVPWSVVPTDESTSVSESVLDEAERALADPNPNPESFDDINSMLARDLLEVGNCVAVTNLQVDGRRAEVVPLDPNSFTADWNQHRILQGFYQYPRANQRWGQPEPLDRDVVLWGVFQPTVTRAGIYGYSPVELVSRFINIMGGLVDKEINELEEGMPSGLITLIGDEWSDRDYDQFETYWNEEVKGEQVKHPYTRGKADFVPFNMTYKEMQVLDRQKWYSKLVASAFRTPVSETGLAIGEEMTRATDVSQRQKYKQRALGSILNQLEQLWTNQYLQRWFSEDIRLRFDPGRDIMEKREIAETNQIELQSGTKTINEVREERGEEPLAWGDRPGTPKMWSTGGGGGGAGGQLTPESENQNAAGPDGEGLPALANKNAASVSFSGTKSGKLDKSKLDADEHTLSDHYLFGSGDTKGDYSYPVVDANGNLRKGNVKSAYKVGASGEGVSESDLHRKLKNLNSEFDSPPLDIEGGDIVGAKAFFRNGGYDVRDGHWLPADAEVAAAKEFRDTEEIAALQEDIEQVYADAIQSVLDMIKGNQQLLRRPTDDQPGADPSEVMASKNLPALMKLVKNVLGIGFAEDIRDVLVEHKVEKVTAGEQDILSELRQAGLSVEDVDLDSVRDRVVSKIRSRTLKITKPISKRLEGDLRGVLETAWREGHRITEVESNIEDLSDEWTGYEAERLARDQLGRASKEGRTEYADATGPEVGGWSRTWIDSSDHRVRDSHERMDGATVGPGESWTVDYTPDGGPPAVDEDYPGDSVYGIQCRCDFVLSPVGLSKSVSQWAEDPSPRMKEVAEEQGRPIDKVLLAAELGDESRTQAHKRLGISRPTYYSWVKKSGLDNPHAAVQKDSFSGGDVVEYADGNLGVVLEVMTSDFTWPQGDDDEIDVEASSDDPAYIVARETGGAKIFRADELSPGSFDGDAPDLGELAGDEAAASKANIPGVDDPEVGFSSLPDGWTRKSVLQAYASLGGSWTSCVADMQGEIRSPKRFCSALKDEVFGTERWRGRF